MGGEVGWKCEFVDFERGGGGEGELWLTSFDAALVFGFGRCIDSRLDQTSLDTVSSLPQVVTSASVDAGSSFRFFPLPPERRTDTPPVVSSALTILLDIRALHTLLAPDAKIRPPIVEEPALLLEDVATPAPVKTLRPLVPLLSALVTWGLDKEMDTRCEEGLGLVRRRDGSVRVGLRG